MSFVFYLHIKHIMSLTSLAFVYHVYHFSTCWHLYSKRHIFFPRRACTISLFFRCCCCTVMRTTSHLFHWNNSKKKTVFPRWEWNQKAGTRTEAFLTWPQLRRCIAVITLQKLGFFLQIIINKKLPILTFINCICWHWCTCNMPIL